MDCKVAAILWYFAIETDRKIKPYRPKNYLCASNIRSPGYDQDKDK